MPGLLTGEYTAELRVFHPDRNEVAFLEMRGHNFGECVNKTANRYAGWVVTDACEPLFVGEPDVHQWNHDGSVCVNCGVLEWMAGDDACSGVYGLL